MELLEGRDLVVVLRERGTLPVAEAVDVVLRACEPHGPPPPPRDTPRLTNVDLKPGDVIDDKYEIEGPPLGKGGMGVVYLALHRQLGTHVALKFIQPRLLTKPDLVSRFLHEARAGMRMKSHHVARVYDIGTHEGSPFIVMERLTGHDLETVLRERGPLSVTEAADYLLQACEALHEAHGLGIVHRDLKPSNLFLTDTSDGLKMLDLGISKSPFAEEAARTATHAVIGSPFYMSPEQVTASRSVDARTDVWSLGVILYQMLGDTVPFAGSSVVEVYAAIRGGAWTKLSAQCEGLPPAVDALVSHALERDRDARIPSVLEFAVRLAPFGGEIARESLARMRRMTARASGAPPAAAPLAEAAKTTPDAPLVAPPASAQPLPRWLPGAALGVIALGGAAGGIAAWASSTPSATTVMSATPSASSSPPEDSAPSAPEPSASTAPSASVVAPSASPPPPTKPACTGAASSDCEAACKEHAHGACESLATALLRGRGAVRNPSRAAALYDAACNEGSMSACNSLGALKGEGDGVPEEDAKAVDLYKRACDGGYARGCVNLGGMYFDGTGAAKDERRVARPQSPSAMRAGPWALHGAPGRPRDGCG